MAVTQPKRSRSPKEGELSKKIEEQTSKIPSDTFLWSAVGTMAVSALLHLGGRRHVGLFFGQWVAPILLFGIYNKLVKIGGHDQTDR